MKVFVSIVGLTFMALLIMGNALMPEPVSKPTASRTMTYAEKRRPCDIMPKGIEAFNCISRLAKTDPEFRREFRRELEKIIEGSGPEAQAQFERMWQSIIR